MTLHHKVHNRKKNQLQWTIVDNRTVLSTSTCYGDMTTQIGHKSKHYNSEGYNVNGHDSYKWKWLGFKCMYWPDADY